MRNKFVMNALATSLAIVLFFATGCTGRDTSKSGFNIVLITIDTLRADHLSCYGYERKTSPHIDAIAKQGIVFKNVVAPSSWTAPSMVSLFTSTYPVNHGVVHGLPFQVTKGIIQEVFSERLTTLPMILKDNGYTTFGVSSNHTLTGELGFARGFDYFKYVNWMPAAVVNSIVYGWENTIKASGKFFLWVHYIDPHAPYYPRSPWIGQYTTEDLTTLQQMSRLPADSLTSRVKEKTEMLTQVLALYDSEINYVDAYIGELIERLKLHNNTLLIIASDHGEQFMEHGSIGHAISLHNEELHVPLIIKLPETSTMRSIEGQASPVDIMPTILHLLNIRQSGQMVGKPLLERTAMQSVMKRLFFTGRDSHCRFAELDSHAILKTIMAPPWKYIYDYQMRSGALYHTASDPYELTNLADKYPERVAALQEQLFSWLSGAKRFPPKSHLRDLSPGEREKLETLGYLRAGEGTKNESLKKVPAKKGWGAGSDNDKDGILNESDNCVRTPNSPLQGTCVGGYGGELCMHHEHCGVE